MEEQLDGLCVCGWGGAKACFPATTAKGSKRSQTADTSTAYAAKLLCQLALSENHSRNDSDSNRKQWFLQQSTSSTRLEGVSYDLVYLVIFSTDIGQSTVYRCGNC